MAKLIAAIIVFVLAASGLARAQNGASPDQAMRNWQIIVRDRVMQRALLSPRVSGAADMVFTVFQDGSVGNINAVAATSQQNALLGARIIRSAYPFPPIPALVDRQFVTFHIRITFRGGDRRRHR